MGLARFFYIPDWKLSFKEINKILKKSTKSFIIGTVFNNSENNYHAPLRDGMATDNLISTLELKRLLFDLKDKRPDVCIRFRLLGEMWAENFMRVIMVTEKGAIFNDESINEFVNVSDVANIMQFEIDNRFQNFQPHYHYEVVESRKWKVESRK